MSTRYIINNLSGQTITGNITINGNVNVTGTSISNNLATYKALISQTASINGNALSSFQGGLIIGETYTVNNYNVGDDFVNVANVLNGGVLTFTYSGTGEVGVTNTYNFVPVSETSGSGVGAEFDVVVNSGVYESVTVTNYGSGYTIGDTLTLRWVSIGGIGPQNDITVTVTGLTPNSSGSEFIATGEIPTNYNNGSTLISSGNLAVTVLENTLGYDISWTFNVFGPGTYLGIRNKNGLEEPYYNDFPRNSTFMKVGTPTYIYGPNQLEMFAGVASVSSKDDLIFIGVYDQSIFSSVNDYLYYLPVEINSKQDTDTTPIVISGTVQSAIPFTYASVDLFCNGNYVESFVGDSTEVTNLPELLAELNTNQATSYLGTYSDAGDGGLLLTIPTNKANQFCSSGILSFEVYAD